MIFQTIVEQRQNDEYRNEYNALTGLFNKTEYKSLLFQRGFKGIYGWLIGYGSPPEQHLDVLTLTDSDYELGSVINVKLIGVFIRNDGDNKLVTVEQTRKENDFADLSKEDRTMLENIYPNIRVGEGWYGKIRAIQLIDDYQMNKETEIIGKES